MNAIKGTNAEIPIFGTFLSNHCSHYEPTPYYMIMGSGVGGNPIAIPVGEKILSRHMLFLGGIGTGKTNAMNLFIRNTRRTMTDRDVMIIFDTKGDFYREFYRPGDVVISNDERANGGAGTDYWNIFNEISADNRIEENIMEIAKVLFSDKIEKTNQPFFG